METTSVKHNIATQLATQLFDDCISEQARIVETPRGIFAEVQTTASRCFGNPAGMARRDSNKAKQVVASGLFNEVDEALREKLIAANGQWVDLFEHYAGNWNN